MRLPKTSAFSIGPLGSASAHHGATLITLSAKTPKRRKRKDMSNESTDSLPDFDIDDPSATTSDSASTSGKQASGVRADTKTGSLNEITPAMMGTSFQKETSVNDLIRDRSLERKFEFDDSLEDASLPDLAVLPNNGEQSLGKKKARQAARMAAAAEKKKEEEEGSMLKRIPFLLDEKGEVSAIKILENGTWLGIGLLVGWEVYINSPLFERAQPMIPVVYDLVF